MDDLEAIDSPVFPSQSTEFVIQVRSIVRLRRIKQYSRNRLVCWVASGHAYTQNLISEKSFKDSDKVSYGDSSDFVFAYRVREIYYEKAKLKTKEHNQGPLFDTEGRGVKARGEDILEYTLEVFRFSK